MILTMIPHVSQIFNHHFVWIADKQIIHWNWSYIMLQLLDLRKGHFNTLQLGKRVSMEFSFGNRSKLGSPRNALWKGKIEETHVEIRVEASMNIQDIHTTHKCTSKKSKNMMHKLEWMQLRTFCGTHRDEMGGVLFATTMNRCSTLLLQRILDGWPPANPSPLQIVCAKCVLMCILIMCMVCISSSI